jgi:hypothetical protein
MEQKQSNTGPNRTAGRLPSAQPPLFASLDEKAKRRSKLKHYRVL